MNIVDDNFLEMLRTSLVELRAVKHFLKRSNDYKMLIRRVETISQYFFNSLPSVYKLQTPRAERILSLWTFYDSDGLSFSGIFILRTNLGHTMSRDKLKKELERFFGNYSHIYKSRHIKNHFFSFSWIIAKDLSSRFEESPHTTKLTIWQIDVSIAAMSDYRTLAICH